jgi:DNA polymerase I-like protein with 3'-5' exonuclease and polymerase domains
MREYSNNLIPIIADLEMKAYALAGRQFLLSSPTQVAAVLYDELKLSEISIGSTAKGRHRTTDSEGNCFLG